MKKFSIQKKRGVTLIELLVSIAILTALIVTVTTFEKDVFTLNYTTQASLNAQLDARDVVKVMVAELRKTAPSATGTYAIELASTTALTFYSDANSDGLQDRIRYFISGKNIQKGVTAPTGSPLVYNIGNEVVTTLISNTVSSSTLPLFQYYPETYAGTSTPLSAPIDLSAIRLVKITVIIDKDPNKSPSQLIVTSEVTLRNLKDNL